MLLLKLEPSLRDVWLLRCFVILSFLLSRCRGDGLVLLLLILDSDSHFVCLRVGLGCLMAGGALGAREDEEVVVGGRGIVFIWWGCGGDARRGG